MDKNNGIVDFINRNRGKILGILVGLVVAILILEYGFFKSLFIFACVGVGWYFGARKENRDGFINLIDGLLNTDREDK